MTYIVAVAVGFWLAIIAFRTFREQPPAAGVPEALDRIILQGDRHMATIDEVLAKVAELPAIGDSLDAVFARLNELIEQGKTDPAKLQEASDLISAHAERTKAAIIANTPAQ